MKWALLAGFVATIPLANWTLERYGFVEVRWLGLLPAGLVWAGLAFVLRDVAQVAAGKVAVLCAIAVGCLLAWWIASPALALASAAAFAGSELVDFAVYTPFAERRWTFAVLASSIVGACVDSVLFLWLAFDTTQGWWQLAVAKCLIVAAAVPFAQVSRRAVIA